MDEHFTAFVAALEGTPEERINSVRTKMQTLDRMRERSRILKKLRSEVKRIRNSVAYREFNEGEKVYGISNGGITFGIVHSVNEILNQVTLHPVKVEPDGTVMWHRVSRGKKTFMAFNCRHFGVFT